jgi:thioredoxin reductase
MSTAFADDITVVDNIDTRIVGLQGSDSLRAVVVEGGGVRKTVPASAVFVYVNRSPAAEFLVDSLARDASGHIVVDGEGRTSAASALAAGDVRADARQSLAEAMAGAPREPSCRPLARVEEERVCASSIPHSASRPLRPRRSR